MSLLSAFGALPTIQTRKALLLLDFQNDFVRPSGALPVSNTADFLDTLPQLVSAFRRSGDIVWVRSHYDSRRSLIDPDYQDRVVLRTEDEERRKQHDHQQQQQQQQGADDPPDALTEPIPDEAFLSTDSPKCCRPQTTGAQFPAPLLAAIDADHDILLEKSDYSALQDDGLILSFRTRFVTELYLCGSLSNVSVYATALDAVRHGFSVTLVEDCLGFRSFARHREAMRRMADIFGASGVTAEELCQELDWQETDAIAQKGGPRPPRSVTPAGIEGVMDELEVKASREAAAAAAAQEEEQRTPPSRKDSRRRRLDDVLADMAGDDDADILDVINLTRSRNRYPSPQTQGSGNAAALGSGEKVRTRVRRRGRNENKPESSSSKLESRRSTKSKKLSQDVCGPGDIIGEGDSRIIHDLDLPSDAFELIRGEVAWQKMYHLSGQVPRLVAVQGQSQDDGSIPIYRHPADESPPLLPFTSTVDQVRVIVERILGHPLNHVLIQLYRDGTDRISEHSDKTLDIARGSCICNVSLGAQRVMTLRTKVLASDGPDSGRSSQRIPMPHESLFVLGEKTNMRWLHAIRPDKRPESEKSMEERAYGGERISLTFRHIGTYLNPTGDTIWGQGAVSKPKDQANPVIHGDAAETEKLIRAFGQENHASEFDWDATYGAGFDVVNFVTPTTAQLVLSGDPVADLRARLGLSENGLRYEVTEAASTDEDCVGPLYIGVDNAKVAGDVAILTHLAQGGPSIHPGVDRLHGGTHLPQIQELLNDWREFRRRGDEREFNSLHTWDIALEGQHYLCGTVFGIDDCALWPVLRDIVQMRGSFLDAGFPNLHQYYQRVEKRGIVKVTLEEIA